MIFQTKTKCIKHQCLLSRAVVNEQFGVFLQTYSKKKKYIYIYIIIIIIIIIIIRRGNLFASGRVRSLVDFSSYFKILLHSSCFLLLTLPRGRFIFPPTPHQEALRGRRSGQRCSNFLLKTKNTHKIDVF